MEIPLYIILFSACSWVLYVHTLTFKLLIVKTQWIIIESFPLHLSVHHHLLILPFSSPHIHIQYSSPFIHILHLKTHPSCDILWYGIVSPFVLQWTMTFAEDCDLWMVIVDCWWLLWFGFVSLLLVCCCLWVIYIRLPPYTCNPPVVICCWLDYLLSWVSINDLMIACCLLDCLCLLPAVHKVEIRWIHLFLLI